MLKNLKIERLRKLWIPIFFNNFEVKNEGVTRWFKVGVTGFKALKTDIENWDFFFLAGRLQKPVEEIIWRDQEVQQLLELNYRNAAHHVHRYYKSWKQPKSIYEDICNLSYKGDFWNYLFIDQNKNVTIVKHNLKKFEALYKNLISKPDLNISVDIEPRQLKYKIF